MGSRVRDLGSGGVTKEATVRFYVDADVLGLAKTLAAFERTPAAALHELSTVDSELVRYHLYHATRAELLRELGRREEARAADRRALELTANPAAQALLEQRILA